MARGDESAVAPAKSEHKVGLVVGGLAAIALLAFVFQNTERARVDWLFWDVEMPLFLLVIITAALTLIVAVIAAWLLGRRKKA